MEHFITNEENTKNKLFIARQLDDEKMSVVSMNVRIASGWLMSFFVLVGIVVILFVTYKNFTTKEKWIIIWVGIGLIFFGLANFIQLFNDNNASWLVLPGKPFIIILLWLLTLK